MDRKNEDSKHWEWGEHNDIPPPKPLYGGRRKQRDASEITDSPEQAGYTLPWLRGGEIIQPFVQPVMQQPAMQPHPPLYPPKSRIPFRLCPAQGKPLISAHLRDLPNLGNINRGETSLPQRETREPRQRYSNPNFSAPNNNNNIPPTKTTENVCNTENISNISNVRDTRNIRNIGNIGNIGNIRNREKKRKETEPFFEMSLDISKGGEMIHKNHVEVSNSPRSNNSRLKDGLQIDNISRILETAREDLVDKIEENPSPIQHAGKRTKEIFRKIEGTNYTRDYTKASITFENAKLQEHLLNSEYILDEDPAPHLTSQQISNSRIGYIDREANLENEGEDNKLLKSVAWMLNHLKKSTRFPGNIRGTNTNTNSTMNNTTNIINSRGGASRNCKLNTFKNKTVGGNISINYREQTPTNTASLNHDLCVVNGAIPPILPKTPQPSNLTTQFNMNKTHGYLTNLETKTPGRKGRLTTVGAGNSESRRSYLGNMMSTGKGHNRLPDASRNSSLNINMSPRYTMSFNTLTTSNRINKNLNNTNIIQLPEGKKEQKNNGLKLFVSKNMRNYTKKSQQIARQVPSPLSYQGLYSPIQLAELSQKVRVEELNMLPVEEDIGVVQKWRSYMGRRVGRAPEGKSVRGHCECECECECITDEINTVQEHNSKSNRSVGCMARDITRDLEHTAPHQKHKISHTPTPSTPTLPKRLDVRGLGISIMHTPLAASRSRDLSNSRGQRDKELIRTRQKHKTDRLLNLLADKWKYFTLKSPNKYRRIADIGPIIVKNPKLVQKAARKVFNSKKS